jgi:hypothetical protein
MTFLYDFLERVIGVTKIKASLGTSEKYSMLFGGPRRFEIKVFNSNLLDQAFYIELLSYAFKINHAMDVYYQIRDSGEFGVVVCVCSLEVVEFRIELIEEVVTKYAANSLMYEVRELN